MLRKSLLERHLQEVLNFNSRRVVSYVIYQKRDNSDLDTAMKLEDPLELERQKADFATAQEHQKALYQTYNVSGATSGQFALSLVRSAFLLNAGAMFALIALLSQLLDQSASEPIENTTKLDFESLVLVLRFFIAGLLFAATGAAFSYFFQLNVTVLFQRFAETTANMSSEEKRLCIQQRMANLSPEERLSRKQICFPYMLPPSRSRGSLISLAAVALASSYVAFAAGALKGMEEFRKLLM